MSRALNGSERVKASTRNLILEEAKRIGYHPNLNARRLQSGHTRTVYFILPSLYDQERIPAEEATKVLARAGYDTLLAVHHHDENSLKRILQRLREGVADGALIISDRHQLMRKTLAPLVEQEFPIIFLDRPLEGLKLPLVTTQNFKGASSLVEMMFRDGVEHFLLNQPTINTIQDDRLKGFLKAISQLELCLLEDPSKGPTKGRRNLPVGLLGNSQGHVLGLLKKNPWLRNHPLVFGVFDQWNGDTHPASHVYTAIQDFEKMGTRAAKRLLQWMEEGKAPRLRKENIPLKGIPKILPLWN